MASKRKVISKNTTRKCQFRPGWMFEKDKKGRPNSEWLEKFDNEHAFCKCCKCTIKFSVIGGQALSHHAETAKHIQNLKPISDPRQLRLQAVPPQRNAGSSTGASPSASSSATTSGSNSGSGLPTIQLYSPRRKSIIAEIYWSLKCVASDFSASSCDDIKDLFTVMFKDPENVNPCPESLQNFSLGRTKFTYVLTDGLAPYFRRKLENDLCGQYYSVLYDETTNEAGFKELRTGVRYWSEREEKVRCDYLRTYFIGKATGEVLSDKLLCAIDESSLPLSKLLMLGCDGPAVNAKVQRLVNEKVKECRGKALLDLGTCNIHIVHNAFNAGLDEFGEDVSEMVMLVHGFFHGWPTRREDFEKIQAELNLPNHRFLKHVPLRWLTLEGASDRLIEQWPALRKYFLDFVPKNQPKYTSKVGYTKIKSWLKSDIMLAKLMFVRNSANMFASFTRTFQKEEPLIHVLHTELRTVALKILNRFSKPEVVKDRGVCLSALKKDHLLPIEQVVVGEDVAAALAANSVNEKTRLLFHKNARDHYVAAGRHLLLKSALKTGSNARYYRCLQPNERCSARSCSDILKITKDLPVMVNQTSLLDEWKLLQQEDDAPGSAVKTIDVYWSQFFRLKNSVGNEFKYPNVTAVVKAALCLSHGQGDVERGFSYSGRTLSSDRASMSERTLDAYMVVKNTLRDYGNRPALVPINNDLITSAEGAHAKYVAYQEEQKRKMEEELQKQIEEENQRLEEIERKESLEKGRKRIIEEEEILKEERDVESKKRKTSQKLLYEGNERLKSALEKGDLEGATLAQALIEAAKKKHEEALEHNKIATAMQKDLDRKKTKLISEIAEK